MKLRLSADAAAALSGFAVLLPVGIRGALFALCPALAGGKRSRFAIAAVLGLLLDVAYEFFWLNLGLVWEPRGEFNRTLAYCLPPTHHVVTHFGCPIPNSIQFISGLTGWVVCFFVLWVRLWPRRLPASAYLTIATIGALLVTTAGGLLWSLAPMDEWRYQVETPERVPVGIFVFALITAIPCCAFCVGVVLSRLEEKPEEVTKKAKQDHGIQRPIGS